MAVVSSIRHNHITNDYNDGAKYFKRFLQYAEMVSTGNMRIARTILDGLIMNEQTKKETINLYPLIATQIKHALELKGYIVDERIGQSNFKCTLGVKKKEDDTQYSLGILTDDESHYQNDDLVEQYYQRPSILRSFRWRIINVFAKDWLEDDSKVINELLQQLEETPFKLNSSDDISKLTQESLQDTEKDAAIIKLNSADGDKFWEITQADHQLHIRFGKSGSKGQIIIKSFTDEEEANFAKETYIEEQLKENFRRSN